MVVRELISTAKGTGNIVKSSKAQVWEGDKYNNLGDQGTIAKKWKTMGGVTVSCLLEMVSSTGWIANL